MNRRSTCSGMPAGCRQVCWSQTALQMKRTPFLLSQGSIQLLPELKEAVRWRWAPLRRELSHRYEQGYEPGHVLAHSREHLGAPRVQRGCEPVRWCGTTREGVLPEAACEPREFLL